MDLRIIKQFYKMRNINDIYEIAEEVEDSPDWCGSVDSVPACELKYYQLDSQPGHMPGLWARSPVGGM